MLLLRLRRVRLGGFKCFSDFFDVALISLRGYFVAKRYSMSVRAAVCKEVHKKKNLYDRRLKGITYNCAQMKNETDQ